MEVKVLLIVPVSVFSSKFKIEVGFQEYKQTRFLGFLESIEIEVKQ